MENKKRIINMKQHNSNRLRLFVPMCFENALISYSKTINLDYRLAFFNYWNFRFVSQEYSKISNNIKYSQELFENMREMCGVNIQVINSFCIEELIEKIKNNLNENLPTIVHTDTFYLHWNEPFYQKFHTNHVSQVCGLDEEKNTVYILDLDFPNEIFELDIEQLELACTYYLVFEKNESFNEKISINVLKEYLNHSNGVYERLKNDIIKFADEFRNSFSYSTEFDEPYGSDQVLASELVLKVRDIIKGRNLFMDFLESVSEINDTDLNDVIQKLFVSASKWNHIINLLVKNSIIGWKSNINEKIASVLYEVAEIEYSAYMLLVNKFYNTKIEESAIKKKKFEDIQSFNVELEQYSNNKGFIYETDICNANEQFSGLTGAGEFFILDKSYSDKKLLFSDIVFCLSSDNEKDNIICEGQHIVIDNNEMFRGIGILCCTEFGTNHDRIKVIGSDSKENVYFDAFDIADYTAKDVIDIGESFSVVSNQIVRDRNVLTVNIIEFDKDIDVKKIVLPYCSNLHIFALTLIK